MSDFAKQMKDLRDNMKFLLENNVYVGLPKGVTSRQYPNGQSVIQVGASHEYGAPSAGIPKRSFLRTPFIVKKKEAKQIFDVVSKQVVDGQIDAKTGLNRMGIGAVKIVVQAFTSKGYGTWAPLKPETITSKGSSQILIDSGILRQSITYVIRKG